MGELWRPRQVAVNLCTAAAREAQSAAPPYRPFLEPKLRAPEGAPSEPHQRKAAEAGENGQHRNKVRTPFLNSGEFGLRHLRCAITGEVVGAWGRFGGVAAMLANLAYLSKLSLVRNMETACRSSDLQHAARAHLGRERGDVDVIKE